VLEHNVNLEADQLTRNVTQDGHHQVHTCECVFAFFKAVDQLEPVTHSNKQPRENNVTKTHQSGFTFRIYWFNT